MIIFGSILTTFELSSIFGGSWESKIGWSLKPTHHRAIRLVQIRETLTWSEIAIKIISFEL
jgi:hypothetical protein